MTYTFFLFRRRKKKDTYATFSKTVATIVKECGANSTVDYWGDDIIDGDIISFLLALQLKDSETNSVGIIKWPSKEVRNEDIAKMKDMMSDSRLQALERPSEGTRITFLGFELLFKVK